MEEKKLTDDEIIKALDCCVKNNYRQCPYIAKKVDCVALKRAENDFLDLIRRLQYGYSSASKASEEWKAKYEAERKENAEYERKLADGDLVSIEWHDEQVGHANEEIERLTEENEYLDMVAKQALTDYQNTQVQVDELTDKLGKVLSGIKADELLTAKGIEQAVKDTLQETENLLHECAMEYANAGHKDYFGVCENISWKVIRKIAKEKGVEVE